MERPPFTCPCPREFRLSIGILFNFAFVGFIVARVARTAIKYSPKDKATLYKNLGYDLPVVPTNPPQEPEPVAPTPGRLSRMFGGGKKQPQATPKYDYSQPDREINSCAETMTVTLDRLYSFLNKEGLYFQDKSSTLFRGKKH